MNDPICIEIRRLVESSSVNAVARRLRIGREVVARLAGGLDVTAGSRALAEQRLAEQRRSPTSEPPRAA